MVLLTLKVRPKSGYSNPGKVIEVSIDSSERLETILAQVKLPKKGSLLFDQHGRPLALNSSVASNNIRNGSVLESCSSPLLSALMSAVLKDLDEVKKVPEEDRSAERMHPLLDRTPFCDPSWSDRWTHEALKARIICLASIKKVLQRDDRYADFEVPHCPNLQSLYDYLHANVWYPRSNATATPNGGRRRQPYCSWAHPFKPNAKNGHGNPSTCWQLVQHKLDKYHRLLVTASVNNNDDDALETFVRQESARHASARGGSTPRRRATPPTANASNDARPPPKRRRLDFSNSNISTRNGLPPRTTTTPSTTTCHSCDAPAEYSCLQQDCPFHEKLSCMTCFRSNHPIALRNHERIPVTDARVKAIIKKQKQQKKGYCPVYASGAFAVIITLWEACITRQQYSLDENELKALAQRRCRSNLYDRQARGRNAFSAVEGLADKGLLRKESIPGSRDAKFSLLPEGERMARLGLAFERSLESVLDSNAMKQEKRQALHDNEDQSLRNLSLIIDTREDATYAARLEMRCQQNKVPFIRKELTAGDYLFTRTNDTDNTETVLPLIIERKSWSDLADSVSGKGSKRLDCVKIGGSGSCSTGRCQLCRMKASGCKQVMFIIEGGRCWKRDDDTTVKCEPTNLCQYCKELRDRHGPNTVHGDLEQVLYRLQSEHGCLIHFTRGYNETIDSLFALREILARKKCQHSANTNLGQGMSYEDFCTNVRSAGQTTIPNNPHGRMHVFRADNFVESIYRGKVRSLLPRTSTSSAPTMPASVRDRDLTPDMDDCVAASATESQTTRRKSIIAIDSDDESSIEDVNQSQESLQILEDTGWKSAKALSKECPPKKRTPDESPCIEIDLDDDDSIDQGKTATARRSLCMEIEEEDEDIVLVDDPKDTDTERRSATNGERGVQLMLVNGLYNYDLQAYKDLNEVWQRMYRDQSAAQNDDASQQVHRFVQKHLGTADDGSLPLVPRSTILFWILYIQVASGYHFHATRETSCEDALRQHWNKSPQVLGRAAAKPNLNRPPTTTTTSRRQKDPPDRNTTCIICTKSMSSKTQTVTTPCGHEFHTICLNRWLLGSKTRKCPMCKYEGLGLPKADIATLIPAAPGTKRASTTPHQQTPRKSPNFRRSAPEHLSPQKERHPPTPQHATAHSSTTSNPNPNHRFTTPTHRQIGGSQSPPRSAPKRPSAMKGPPNSVREARLRRFEVSSPPSANTNSTHSTSTTINCWICDTCTLQNEGMTDQCEACGGGRTWKCRSCTLQNAWSNMKCEACTSERNTSSVERPTAHSPGRAPNTNRPPRPTPISNTDQTSRPETTRRRVRCGACGLEGHNRGTATAATCTAYDTPREIELRNKKKEAATQKAETARRDADEFRVAAERSEAAREERNATLERLLSEQTRDNDMNARITEAELHRRRKAAARAERRARKLRG